MHCQNTISCDKIENTIFGSVIIGKDEVPSSNLGISSSKNLSEMTGFLFCFGHGFESLVPRSFKLATSSIFPSVYHARKSLWHKAFRALFASVSRQFALKPYTWRRSLHCSLYEAWSALLFGQSVRDLFP